MVEDCVCSLMVMNGNVDKKNVSFAKTVEHSSFCPVGHTPLCRGLPHFDLSHRKGGHTLHARLHS